ncbi:MAG: DUF554 domain-containing protein [Anaerolineaceae bacterium]
MIGTWINVGTVLIGGVLGVLLGSRIPEKLRHTVVSGLGLFTLALGLQMFLKTENALIVLGAVLLGVLTGELLHIEDGLQNLGVWLERKVLKDRAEGGGGRFIRGFLTASLLFCVGPMAILGSIQDGMTGDYNLLAVKSVMDGFSALAFASSLGVGVLFSALSVLLYQGGLTLLAAQAQAAISTTMMAEMTAAGGVIMIGLAISSLLEIKKIRVANFVPALVYAPLLVWIVSLFS